MTYYTVELTDVEIKYIERKLLISRFQLDDFLVVEVIVGKFRLLAQRSKSMNFKKRLCCALWLWQLSKSRKHKTEDDLRSAYDLGTLIHLRIIDDVAPQGRKTI